MNLVLQNQLELLRAISYVRDVPQSIRKRLEAQVDETKKAIAIDHDRIREIRGRLATSTVTQDDVEFLLGLVTE